MSESCLRSTPNNLKRGLLAVGMALAPVAIAACSNPTQNAGQTASSKIRPCPDSLGSPNSSDGVRLSKPYSKLLASADHQAEVIYNRVEDNQGEITLNPNLGTSAAIKGHKLNLKIDDNADLAQGFEVDISFASGDPVIGIGALACNALNGGIYETDTYSTINFFYGHTENFATTASSNG